MQLTREQFQESIIAQDDDNDYSESGFVACVFADSSAAIGRYSHCSCYDTFESLVGGGISDYSASENVAFDWIGSVDAMIEIAEKKEDPVMAGREASKDDYDYDHLMAVYDQILEWAKKRDSHE